MESSTCQTYENNYISSPKYTAFEFKVSGSKLWLQERSCMCCQESGEREAVVQLFCPKAKSGEPKVRRVSNGILFLDK